MINKSLLVISTVLTLSACQTMTTERIDINTVPEQLKIEIQKHPKPLRLYKDVKIYVVTKQNFKKFVKTYEKRNRTGVFYAISPRDYQKMALNIAELKRYISQQKAIIVYYERRIKEVQK